MDINNIGMLLYSRSSNAYGKGLWYGFPFPRFGCLIVIVLGHNIVQFDYNWPMTEAWGH